MSDNRLQLTLREMQALMAQPNAVIGILAVALILGVSGPFQTFDQLLLVPRIFYWLAMSILTFVTGSFFGFLLPHFITVGHWPKALRMLSIGVVSGVPVTLVVCTINWLAFGIFGAGTIGALALGFYCVLISAAVALLLDVRKRTEPVEHDVRLMQRLPVAVRGRLVSLSVADHYVEVTTTRGKALVLLRLSDAMGEVGATAGLQIHRSHWVTLEGIKAVRRDAGKVLVLTTAGAELPASRSYVPALKNQGLLA